MQNQSQIDKANQSIEASGATLEDALREASIQLGIPVKKMVYEVIQKGGVSGLKGKAPWRITAYAQAKEAAIPSKYEEDFIFGDAGKNADEEVKNKDGQVCVRRQPDGIFMKAIPPTGTGKKASLSIAKEILMRRKIDNYDVSIVEKIVKRADNQYVRIAPYQYNPSADPVLSITITEMEMKAYLIIQPPGAGGADLSADIIRAFMKNNRVTFGVKEDVLASIEDNPVYNEEILVAEGVKPKNGADAAIVYNFKVDHSTIDFKEKNGRIDFKELNLIENVVAGQQLAKKTPPEPGQLGHTVTGKTMPAKSGKDVAVTVGKNVKLSEDRSMAIAEINGQVILLNGKINVEPVYTVTSDVNPHTGNIIFLGTVVIRGSVEDGYSVKAAGNIEVNGNVGKALLDADGDVIIHQGMMGRNEGRVRAGKNVYAKFIEHAQVEAEESVYVSDGILHSIVDANKKIICQGRRASIVGGRLRAAEEINAKNLGSIAGAETILEVGYDPKSKEKLVGLQGKSELLTKELEEINRNLTTLENLKKIQKKLPDEKQKFYDELSEKKIAALTEMEHAKQSIEEIKAYLGSLKIKGKISASERVFPGVKICLKDVMDRVRVEQKSVTYVLEDKRIRMTRYEPGTQERARRR
ncbi:MAG: FapA family protein [Spirochaetales bacterium]|nr:FapA family protein [Spirochaetales bacterium]